MNWKWVVKPCTNTHKYTCKPTQWSVKLVRLKHHVHGGRSDMRRSNLHHSVGLTWQLPARAGTHADRVPVSSQWVVSLFSDREGIQSYPDKSNTVQRRRTKTMQECWRICYRTKERERLLFKFLLCACVCLPVNLRGHLFFYSDENNQLNLTCVTLKLDDSFQSDCHSHSHPSSQFHYHLSVSIELCLRFDYITNFHLGRTQMGRSNTSLLLLVRSPAGVTWQLSDTVTAEGGWDAKGRDVMSRHDFTPLIAQTSPLPSHGILQEKVSRLAHIKTSSPCMSRPPPAQPVLCPRHTSETWLMPQQDF